MVHPVPPDLSKSSQDSNQTAARRSEAASSYWRANLRVVGVLLSVWFFVGYVISIYYVDWFNSIHIGQLGLGFWFAQQGSILVFVVLVWLYAILMDKVDRRYQQRKEQ